MKDILLFNTFEEFKLSKYYYSNVNVIAGFVNNNEDNSKVSYNKIYDNESYDEYTLECFSIRALDLIEDFDHITISIKYQFSGNDGFILSPSKLCYNPDIDEVVLGEDYELNTGTVVDSTNNIRKITFTLEENEQVWILAGNKYTSYTITDDSGDEPVTEQHGSLEFEVIGGYISIQGNIKSLLLYQSNLDPAYAFAPANETLVDSYRCYQMFKNCPIKYAHNLVLPYMTLTTYCYTSMFSTCTELKSVPKLPSVTISTGCYYSMFNGCTSLEDISYLELSAPTIYMNSYRGMFYRCYSLKYIMKELRFTQDYYSTTAYYNCYAMFFQCKSLTRTPKLYIKQTGARGLASMFEGCTSLVTVDTIEIENTVRNYACYNMFNGCTKLVNVFPELIFTTTNQHNFRSMFEGCKALVRAPKLTSRTGKFDGSGYNAYRMFANCTKLNYLDVSSITSAPGSTVTQAWLTGVSASGTFVTVDKTLWSTGTGGIPSGWTAVDPNGNIL